MEEKNIVRRRQTYSGKLHGRHAVVGIQRGQESRRSSQIESNSPVQVSQNIESDILIQIINLIIFVFAGMCDINSQGGAYKYTSHR